MEHDTDEPPCEPPEQWLAILDEAEADVAAGRTVPLEQVLADLQASLDRVEARQAVRAPNAIKA